MKNKLKILSTICFLFITLMSNHCGDIDHKNPLDPENPVTHGKVDIEITDPVEGQLVTMRYIVTGTVSPRAEITVLVHPLTTNLHWVQNFPIVENDGSWECEVGFGVFPQPDTVDYQVYAVTPRKNLKHGQMLDSVPENTNISNVPKVTRLPD